MKLPITLTRNTKGCEIRIRLPWWKAARKPITDAARRHMSAAQRKRHDREKGQLALPGGEHA